VQKLAYEWKNIYRMLSQYDSENSGLVPVIYFEKSCIKAGITLGQSEIQRLVKNYG
jgi:tmRNA-binding protein